jgi:hypothetical protein
MDSITGFCNVRWGVCESPKMALTEKFRRKERHVFVARGFNVVAFEYQLAFGIGRCGHDDTSDQVFQGAHGPKLPKDCRSLPRVPCCRQTGGGVATLWRDTFETQPCIQGASSETMSYLSAKTRISYRISKVMTVGVAILKRPRMTFKRILAGKSESSGSSTT